MALRRKRSATAWKVEATAGTAEALLAADGAFNAYNVSIAPDVQFSEREGNASLSELIAVPGGRGARFSLEVDLYDSAAWAAIFMPAAGFVGAAAVYTPQSSGAAWKTLTGGWYIDGKRYLIKGAMVERMVFPFIAGQASRVTISGRGVWVTPDDTAIIAPTYPLTSPPRFASATLTIGAYTPKISRLEISINNTLALLEDATVAEGFYRALITGRQVRGTIDPEDALVATYDPHALAIAQTEAALAVSYSTTLAVSVPKLQWRMPQPGDRQGVAVHTAEFQANRSAAAGDDEISITF